MKCYKRINLVVFTNPKTGVEDRIPIRTESSFLDFEPYVFKKVIRWHSIRYCLYDPVSAELIHRSVLFAFNLLSIQLFLFKYRIIGNCYTSPAYRGRGIYGEMVSFIMRDVNNSSVVLFVDESNFQSIKGLSKIGCDVFGHYEIYRLFKIFCLFKRK